MATINMKIVFMLAIVIIFVLWYFSPKKEGFNPDHIFDYAVNINSYTGNRQLPIQNYLIKSSYNTAIDGNDFVSKDAIRYVINRGCRFLDFEIMKRDGQIVVGKTTDRNYETTQTRNHIPLETALEAVMGYGFVLTAPNPSDPMFIHLRIKVIEDDYDAYSDIAKSITQIVGDRLYKGTINPSTTPLLSLQGKVILVVDNTYDPSFKTRSNCNATDKCFELGNIMNIESGTKELCRKKRFVDIMDEPAFHGAFNQNGALTNRTGLVIGVPEFYNDNDSGAPSIYKLLSSHAVQIPCYRIHLKSPKLVEYDNFFNHHGSAFVPLENAIAYAKRATE